MTKRIKLTLKPLPTRDAAEAAMTDLATFANEQRVLIARRDQHVLDVNERYATQLADLDNEITVLTQRLKDWAESNPDAFPKGRKSIDFAAGVLGFRTGTPKLKLLSRAWTWDKVLAAALSTFPNFIRSKPELDKEALIAQREELVDLLPLIGVKVDQDESFYVEPALTNTDCKQTA